MVSYTFLVSILALPLLGFTNAKAVPGIEIREPRRSPRAPSYCNNVSKLISVLKRDRLQSFCKKYVNYKPGDVRKVVRTATATTCTNGNRRCIPTTITPVVQTTITSTTTITVDEGTVTDYIYTTPTTTIETTITSTVDTVTSTYTVGSPQLRKRKAPKPPSCIRSCAPNKISAACSTLVIPLITTTRTTTVRGTVRTVIANARTTTITVPITVYSVLPGQTVTNTKTKPTQTETVTRTEDVTFTTTETVCPSRTPGAFAIGVVHNGPDTPAYIQPEAGSEVDCCSACYADRGCFGWLWSSGCTYVQSQEQTQDPDRTCPSSLRLLLISDNTDNGAGGRGPCFGS